MQEPADYRDSPVCSLFAWFYSALPPSLAHNAVPIVLKPALYSLGYVRFLIYYVRVQLEFCRFHIDAPLAISVPFLRA